MVNPKQTSPIKNKNKFKKILTIIISLIVIGSIIGLILFYMLNNRITLSYAAYREDLKALVYKNNPIQIQANDSVKVGIGPNTITVTGSFHVIHQTKTTKKVGILYYTSTFSRDDYKEIWP